MLSNRKIADIVFSKYSDDQPRDESGRFAGGGGSSSEANHGEQHEHHVGQGRARSTNEPTYEEIAALYGAPIHMRPRATKKAKAAKK